MPLKAQAPVPPVERLVSARGDCEIWSPTSHVVACALSGTVEPHFADAVLAKLDAARQAQRKVSCFVDTSRVDDYLPIVREKFTAYFRQHRDALQGVHVLVHLPLVRVGIALANLSLNGLIVSYSQRELYQRQLELTAAYR